VIFSVFGYFYGLAVKTALQIGCQDSFADFFFFIIIFYLIFFKVCYLGSKYFFTNLSQKTNLTT